LAYYFCAVFNYSTEWKTKVDILKDTGMSSLEKTKGDTYDDRAILLLIIILMIMIIYTKNKIVLLLLLLLLFFPSRKDSKG